MSKNFNRTVNSTKVANENHVIIAANADNSEVTNEQSEVITLEQSEIITSAISDTNTASIIATSNVLRKLQRSAEEQQQRNELAAKMCKARTYNASLQPTAKAAKQSEVTNTTNEKKYSVLNATTNNKHELAALYLQLFFSEKITCNGFKNFNDLQRLNLNTYFVNSGFATFVTANCNTKFDINNELFIIGKSKFFVLALQAFINIGFATKPLDYKFASERLKVYFTHSKTFEFIKALQTK